MDINFTEIILDVISGTLLGGGFLLGFWAGSRSQNKAIDFERKRCEKFENQIREMYDTQRTKES